MSTVSLMVEVEEAPVDDRSPLLDGGLLPGPSPPELPSLLVLVFPIPLIDAE